MAKHPENEIPDPAKDAEFQKVVRRFLKTPPKPHKKPEQPPDKSKERKKNRH